MRYGVFEIDEWSYEKKSRCIRVYENIDSATEHAQSANKASSERYRYVVRAMA